jgi:flagellin
MERLSSGFRINSAKDDAAGLAVANKLGADVRALQQASRNAAQATAMLQVADGAAQSIGDILVRMKELATQANSSNIGDQADKLQDEFAALISEIDRITATTQYQGTTLVDGSFGSTVNLATAANTWDAAGTGVANVSLSGTKVGTYTIDGSVANELTIDDGNGNSQTVAVVAGRGSVSFSQFGITLETTADFTAGAGSSADAAVIEVEATTQANFQLSSSGLYAGDDRISVAAIDLTAGGLSVDTLDIDDLNGGDVAAALTAIDAAIDTVNSKLGEIGASMNRIDFAQQNTEILLQNTQAAESVIRDADMAYEMMQFTKNNILSQASQAMLAQANQQPQSVLQLLR